jgi:hypothetical protein
MQKFLAKTGLAALIAVSGIVAPMAAASAADNGLVIQAQYRGDDHRGRGGPRHRDVCSPGLAEEKASRMGLRRARVVDVNRRVVVVSGFDRRGPDRMVFANERGCPVIRR